MNDITARDPLNPEGACRGWSSQPRRGQSASCWYAGDRGGSCEAVRKPIPGWSGLFLLLKGHIFLNHSKNGICVGSKG